MTLGEKQRKFVRLVANLINYAYSAGFELTFGETYRTPEQAALNTKRGVGISNSLHTLRLAIDFNLFLDGEYQADSEAYHELGLYWESLDPDCRWGGRFRDSMGRPKPDGCHFSLTHDGIS